MKKYLFIVLVFIAQASFAVWDKTTPTGTESKSLGDDRIRELKADIETSLQYQGSFPGADTSNPRYINVTSSGTTAERPTGDDAPAGMFYVNVTSNTIDQSQGNGSWLPVAQYVLPPGVILPFFESACPDGWTQVVSENDKVLRVVSGTGGGNGGTVATSTTLRHSHTNSNHTHDIASSGAHAHDIHSSAMGSAAAGAQVGFSPTQTGSKIVATTGGGYSDYEQIDNYTDTDGAHTHTTGNPSTLTMTEEIAGGLAYIDIILCTKN